VVRSGSKLGGRGRADHGSIGGSRPIAFLGRARGHSVSEEASPPWGKPRLTLPWMLTLVGAGSTEVRALAALLRGSSKVNANHPQSPPASTRMELGNGRKGAQNTRAVAQKRRSLAFDSGRWEHEETGEACAARFDCLWGPAALVRGRPPFGPTSPAAGRSG
jgi:hypothetical protein